MSSDRLDDANSTRSTTVNEPPGDGSLPVGESTLRLLSEIARGGMGCVLQGRDDALHRDVAVKVLLEEYKDRPELLRRFLEEARIAG